MVHYEGKRSHGWCTMDPRGSDVATGATPDMRRKHYTCHLCVQSASYVTGVVLVCRVYPLMTRDTRVLSLSLTARVSV